MLHFSVKAFFILNLGHHLLCSSQILFFFYIWAPKFEIPSEAMQTICHVSLILSFPLTCSTFQTYFRVIRGKYSHYKKNEVVTSSQILRGYGAPQEDILLSFQVNIPVVKCLFFGDSPQIWADLKFPEFCRCQSLGILLLFTKYMYRFHFVLNWRIVQSYLHNVIVLFIKTCFTHKVLLWRACFIWILRYFWMFCNSVLLKIW